MAKWDFNSSSTQCNGAKEQTFYGNNGGPIFVSNLYYYCPNKNAGCAKAILGSVRHKNTDFFQNVLCLWSFYDYQQAPMAGYDSYDPVWRPKSDANFYINYELPAGKTGSINSFSLNIMQSQFDGSTVNFEKQGVAVYRNGVLIYNETQPILASNVNKNALVFTFPNTNDFISDGSTAVTFKIVFGLVHLLRPKMAYGNISLRTGYDNICINGTCGSSPTPVATATPATCGAGGANSNGTITLSNFGATDHYDYSLGSTYTGGKSYATATAIPAGGVITNTLPNPAAPQVYTVRVFTAAGCTTDLQVTLQPVNCPVNCTQPSGSVSAVQATCAGSTANNDAKLVVSGVSGGDKVAYTAGSTYTGGGYAAATALSGGAYTFTGIANPATTTFYTVRIYNSETCYKDYPVALEPKTCQPDCTNPTANVAANSATCTAGVPNNNASITITGVSNGDRVDYTAGATYTGGGYASATALSGGAYSYLNIANPAVATTYTIRVFNGSGTCYTDYPVVLSPVICNCPTISGSVSAVQATCTGSTANNDAQLVVSGVSGGDKVAYTAGSTYTGGGYAAATALSGGAYTFTGIANPATTTYYTIRIFTNDVCYKDYTVALSPKTCQPSCTNPAATVVANSATCTVAVPNNDASITITGVSNGDRVDYTAGSSYTGSGYASATALVGGAYSYTGLANPASATNYTVRVFNGSNTCYTDYPIVLSPAVCPCPTPTGTLSVVKATCTVITPNANGSITLSGIGNGDKVGYSIGSSYTGPAYASASSISGALFSLTGLASPSSSTTYTIRVFNTANTCYKDFQAILDPTVCPCPTPVATVVANTATCGTGGVPNSDASIAISGVSNGDKVDYSLGSIYSGGGYAAATALSGGAYTFTGLADPQTAPFTYTVRVFNTANSCYKDYQVILNPVICPNCVPPSAPATLVVTNATCGATGTNNNASIAVNGVVGGDRVGISPGTFYVGVPYSQAQTLVGAAYTFSNLPNPANGTQSYTVRVFNGKDDCFKDYSVSLSDVPCTCKKTYFEIVCADQFDPNSTVNNAITSEDDFAVYELCKDNKYIDLKLTKTVSPNSGVTCPTGTDFVWTLTLTNVGTMTATDIQVADILPTGLVLTASNTATGTYGQSAGWMIPSLAPNTPVTLTLTTKALVTGTFQNCAEVMSASPLNDPNSTPGNGVTTEDDYACASITVTGSKTPEISKEFSPMGAKPNVPVRLTIKITNNEATPITLTQALVDNLPSSPAQMTVAATPNLLTTLSGVVATAGSNSITIPSGTVLLPGLNTIQVDVIGTAEGIYCNTIAAGALKTTACDNVVKAEACIDLKNSYVLAPLISKTMLPAVIQAGQNSTLTLTIENRNTETITLLQDFTDYLPTGLVTAGAVGGTCPNVSLFGGTTQVGITSGAVLAGNSTCTITVPVTSSTAGYYCNFIAANSMIGNVNKATGDVMTGNEDHPEACVTVNSVPCTTIDLTSITQTPTGTVGSGATVNLSAVVASGLDPKTVFTWSNTPTGGSYNIQAQNTAWTAPTTAGTYTIKVVGNNSLTGYGTCKDSVTLSITVGSVCTNPTGKGYGVATSCTNGLANNDAKIVLYSLVNADKVGYSSGTTYTGSSYASATTVSGGNANFTNLQAASINGTKYTVRIFNGSDACFTDILVIVPYSDCNLTCTVDAGPDQLLCEPVATIDLKDATATEEWIEGSNNPAPTSINASTGVVTGMSVNGVYSYILRDKNNTSCSDIMYVFRGVMALPSQSSCETSYQLPTQTGVTWSVVSGGVSVTTSGLITGMNTNGLYQFSANFNGCISTIDVFKVTCACQKPNAGADLAICLPKTTADLTDAPNGYSWIAQASNPAPASISASTGVITGMTVVGTYKFILQNTTDATCADTMQIVSSNPVPIVLCNDGSTSYNLVAPSNLSNVIWYNMAGVQVGTGTILVVKSTTLGLEDGSEAFYYRGVDGSATGCDIELCCPVKFLTQTCCPVPNCVGITIIKN